MSSMACRSFPPQVMDAYPKRMSAGAGEIGYRTNVRAFIKRIRQKFRDADAEFSHIENYPGFGYRWSDTGAN